MREKKIRGHRRRWKQIAYWQKACMELDMNRMIQLQRDYAKIWISPWSDRPLTNSIIPVPRGKTKEYILKGMLDIYANWKIALDKTGQPYYLKLWLFEPRFTTSQVVCAIGDKIDYYNSIFFKPSFIKSIVHDKYGNLKDKLGGMKWDFGLDEDLYQYSDFNDPSFYTSPEEYEESKRWLINLLKRPHRVMNHDDDEIYFVQKGFVWVGEYDVP